MSDQPTHEPLEQSTERPIDHARAVPAPRLSPGADIGGLIAGAVFTALGVLFLLEAADIWTFALSDLRYLAPLALIVIGASVVIGGLRRADANAKAT